MWAANGEANFGGMRLGTMLDYSQGFKQSADQAADLERAGIDVLFVAEAYGFDAPSQMGYIAARTEHLQIASGILPIYSRTPALIAQTAAGIDAAERRSGHPRSRRRPGPR